MGSLAAVLGWVVTDVSCRGTDAAGAETSCSGWAIAIAIVSFVFVTLGVALLLVLVFRSLSEWHEHH
jgi:hypothetical protein